MPFLRKAIVSSAETAAAETIECETMHSAVMRFTAILQSRNQLLRRFSSDSDHSNRPVAPEFFFDFGGKLHQLVERCCGRFAPLRK